MTIGSGRQINVQFYEPRAKPKEFTGDERAPGELPSLLCSLRLPHSRH